MDSGTSFDGEEIESILANAFYHFGPVNRWKHFKRVTFEVDAQPGTVIAYRMDTDYEVSDTPIPTSDQIDKQIPGDSGTWGFGVWGTFIWGTSGLARTAMRTLGYGANMRLHVSSTSKYKNPHTIHSLIPEYTIGSLHVIE
jgi:hypothetical protein